MENEAKTQEPALTAEEREEAQRTFAKANALSRGFVTVLELANAEPAIAVTALVETAAVTWQRCMKKEAGKATFLDLCGEVFEMAQERVAAVRASPLGALLGLRDEPAAPEVKAEEKPQ